MTWRRPAARTRRTSTTLEEVAHLAGVSRATVSRVVNGSPKVSPDVRIDVQAAIDRLGYVPNRAARSLVTRRSDSIAVVITEPTGRLFSDPFFPRLLRGISSELAARDRQLILLMPDTIADESRTAEYLTAGHVDGALLVSLHADDPLPARLAAAGIPIVLVGRPPKGIKASFVDVDNRQGAQSAVAHLIAGGRRVVATIAGPQGHGRRRRPAAGYRDALADAGIAADPSLEIVGDFTQESGAAAMGRLLEARPDIDAVFAASDLDGGRRPGRPRRGRPPGPGRRRGRRLRRLAGRDDHDAPADQRPTTDRSDGPRGGPPACRCRRGLRSRASARDPGHRTGTARIERREAVALSRPATGGRAGRGPGRPNTQPPLRWEIARSRHEEEIPGCNSLDPGPAR